MSDEKRFCEQCGASLGAESRFCASCGAEARPQAQEPPVPPNRVAVRGKGGQVYYVQPPKRRPAGWKIFAGIGVLVVIGIIASNASGSGSGKSHTTSKRHRSSKVVAAARKTATPTRTPSPPTARPTRTPTPTATATPEPKRSVAISGRLATIERVGVPTNVTLNVRNTGATLKNLVLDLSGVADHWVIDSLNTNSGGGSRSEAGEYYGFGRLWHGRVFRAIITITPKDAGNHRADIRVADGWDSFTHLPDTYLDGVTEMVAINP